MRFTMMSILLLVFLVWTAAATAGNHEAGEQAGTEMPPVEASAPETPIAAPASPGMPDGADADAEEDEAPEAE